MRHHYLLLYLKHSTFFCSVTPRCFINNTINLALLRVTSISKECTLVMPLIHFTYQMEGAADCACWTLLLFCFYFFIFAKSTYNFTLSAILGLHSMLNQDQFHSSILNKGQKIGDRFESTYICFEVKLFK